MIFLSLLVGIASGTFAQNGNLDGKWKEYKRSPAYKTGLSNTDTLFLEFTKDSYKESRSSTMIPMRYNLKYTGGKPDLSDAGYTTVQSSTKELVVKDDDFTYYLRPFQPNAIPVAGAIFDIGNIKLTDKNTSGKWEVYKRDGMLKSPDAMMLRSIEFTKDDKGQPSALVFMNSMGETKQWDCSYTFDEKNLDLKSPDFSNNYRLLKADEKETILERDGITYYLRKTK